jgi:hypothetical protein
MQNLSHFSPVHQVRRSAQVLRSFACPESIREEENCTPASHLFIDNQLDTQK